MFCGTWKLQWLQSSGSGTSQSAINTLFLFIQCLSSTMGCLKFEGDRVDKLCRCVKHRPLGADTVKIFVACDFFYLPGGKPLPSCTCICLLCYQIGSFINMDSTSEMTRFCGFERQASLELDNSWYLNFHYCFGKSVDSQKVCIAQVGYQCFHWVLQKEGLGALNCNIWESFT